MSLCAANYLRRTLQARAEFYTPVVMAEVFDRPIDARPGAVVLLGPERGLRARCEQLGIPCWSIADSDGSSLGRSTRLRSAARQAPAELDLVVTGPDGAAATPVFIAVGMTVRSTMRNAMAAFAATIEVGAGNAGVRADAISAGGVQGRKISSAGMSAAGVARRGGRILRGFGFSRMWRVGVLDGASLEDVGGSGPLPVSWIEAGSIGLFWADPFPVIDDDGRTWVFVEEYERTRGLGQIAALRIESRRVAERIVVLQTEHHLAFPQAMRSGGGWVATADTCESPTPLFTFTHPGAQWRKMPGRYLPTGVVDPQLADGPSGWVVAGTDRRYDGQSVARVWRRGGGSPQDWMLEPSGSYVDIRYARSGGSLDLRRNVRAVQDCAGNYGMAVSLIESPPGLADSTQSRLRRLEPTSLVDERQQLASPLGVHTLAWTPDASFIVVDGWWRFPHPLSAYWRMRERAHHRICAPAGADCGSGVWEKDPQS
ncbi:MAG: hypothetical protein U0990_02665 [Candidatus Nanopelagicales bacterium]|nr:hypothetical protein [Candidatus Nanopelagicales bacterium]MDZ4248974.1 hypothetical protein [Candidatus Nanopelagicales bacterium]